MLMGFLRKLNSKYKIKSRLLDFATQSFLKTSRLSKANSWSMMVANELQKLQYRPQGPVACHYTTFNPLLLWRAQTLYEKEPETINWLNSLPQDDVLFDIGANVGMYSIYAGKRGLNVLSFEPESANNFILNRNIAANDLSGKVKAFPFAIGDQEALDVLKLTDTLAGSAHTTFGDNEAYRQVSNPTVFSQGCFCTTIDDLVYKYDQPFPQHIKIDVDGIEAKIIKGGSKVIEDKRLKSILIELNEDMEEDRWIKDFLTQKSFIVKATSEGVHTLKDKMLVRDYVFVRS